MSRIDTGGKWPPRDQLELFVERAQELNNCRLLRKGFSPGFTLNWKKMQGLKFEFRQPEDGDLKEFILIFRHFVASGEPTQLYKIYSLLHQVVTDEQIRKDLAEARAQLTEDFKEGNIKLKHQGKDLTPEYIADLWINGIYFHNNLNDRRKLEDLAMEHFLVRHAFLFFLVDVTRNILYVGNVALFSMREGLVDYSRARQ